MHLSELLSRVEPSRLRNLTQLFEVSDDLSSGDIIEFISDELPYCQTEPEGDCIGLDGAHFIVADLISDMTALELLVERSWVRTEPDGRVITYHVDQSASELPLADVRLLLALLSIATSGDVEMEAPSELEDSRFASVLKVQMAKAPSVPPPMRPSQRPSRFPRERRPSIPPGFSPTLDSVRPGRNSVPPGANSSNSPRQTFSNDKELVESILMLPRNSVIAAALALNERGHETHAVAVGARGRAILRKDQLKAAEQLFDDVADTLVRVRSPEERSEVEKQLTRSLTFYGVKSADAAAVVACGAEQGRFPEFYSDERPPPLEQVRGEFSMLTGRAHDSAMKLLYEVFYKHCAATADSLRSSLSLPRQG